MREKKRRDAVFLCLRYLCIHMISTCLSIQKNIVTSNYTPLEAIDLLSELFFHTVGTLRITILYIFIFTYYITVYN